MAIWLPLFLAAVTVKQDNTPLRSGGCDQDAEVVARLNAATPVDIKYSITVGTERCYRVNLKVDGKSWSGFVPAAALTSTDDFDRAAQEGALIGGSSDAIKRALSAPGAAKDSPTQKAAQLLDANQPSAALAILQTLVKDASSDPDVYVMAGFAAWRSDQPREALDYWQTSLLMRPDPNLQALYTKVEREVKSDKSGERLVGLRVMLRFERDMMPMVNARQMLDVLDAEVSRVSFQIGCPTNERLVAIVQSREAYFQTTQAAEWSGGQYNGRIRVPYDPSLTPSATQRLFAHEVVHACLANLGNWPPWLHEGLAQKMSGDKLSPEMRAKIIMLAERHALPKLQEFRRDWSGMSTENASIAYMVSLAAAELLFENYANTGLVNILRNPNQFAQITADLNHRLGLE